MKTRLEGLIESFIVIAILLAIYWLAGFIIMKIFKKEIRNDKGYLACIIGGYILKRAIISSTESAGKRKEPSKFSSRYVPIPS